MTTVIMISIMSLMLACVGYQLVISSKGMTKDEKMEIVKQTALGLVVLAESKFGAKTGPVKYAWVVMEVYKALPSYITNWITPSNIGNVIEWAVEEFKKMLESNPKTKANLTGI